MGKKKTRKKSVPRTNSKKAASDKIPVVEYRTGSNGKTVGIIGCKGNYGKWLVEQFMDFEFEGSKCNLIGSDTDGSNQETVERSDVVVFSVPIRTVVEIIRGLVNFSRDEQLWMDITSVKEGPMKAMSLPEGCRADVIGLHPMCGPPKEGESLTGQKVAVCYEDLKNPQWKDFAKEFLEYTSATAFVVSPEEHDENMSLVQTLPHALSFLFAATFGGYDEPKATRSEDTDESNEGVSLAEAWCYATPPFKLTYAAVARILASRNWDMYIDMQIVNKKYSLPMLKQLSDLAEHLHNLVEADDVEGIKTLLESGREKFKKHGVDVGAELFSKLLPFMADLENKNSKVIHCTEDGSGLLHRILRHLRQTPIGKDDNGRLTPDSEELDVNMSSLHSFPDAEYGRGFRFQISTKQDRNSWVVQEAMKRIRSDPLLRHIVVIEDV